MLKSLLVVHFSVSPAFLAVFVYICGYCVIGCIDIHTCYILNVNVDFNVIKCPFLFFLFSIFFSFLIACILFFFF